MKYVKDETFGGKWLKKKKDEFPTLNSLERRNTSLERKLTGKDRERLRALHREGFSLEWSY